MLIRKVFDCKWAVQCVVAGLLALIGLALAHGPTLAQAPGENPVMDLRMRQTPIAWTEVTGTLEIILEARTLDGMPRAISQMQDAVYLSPNFNALVQSVAAEFVFPDHDYNVTWRYSSFEGIIQFQSFTYGFVPVYLGGPDADTWHWVATFTVTFSHSPTHADRGSVVWWWDTPDYLVSAVKLDGSGLTETIHNEEIGTLENVPLNLNLMDMSVRLENQVCGPVTGTVDLVFEVQGADQNQDTWLLFMAQNAVVVDPASLALIQDVRLKAWGFPEAWYIVHERWVAAYGELEFQIVHKAFQDFIILGPEPTPLVTFTMVFTVTPGANGTVDWYSGSPDYSLRAGRVDWPDTHLIYGLELSLPQTLTFGCAMGSYALPLDPGWNLVSIPLDPDNPALPDALSSIEGHYDSVWAYDGCDAGDPWKLYNPAAPPFNNDLAQIGPDVPFWIDMTVADTLVVSGTAPTSTSFSLCGGSGGWNPGWNMVGWPAHDASALPQALDSIAGIYTVVWGYDSGGWTSYVPGRPTNDLTTLTPGAGYWIQVTQDATLHVAY